jgi:hypothetical protein
MVFVQFGLIGLYWSYLPEEVPIHFSLDGHPDRMGSKQEILLLPFITLLLILMFEWVNRSLLKIRLFKTGAKIGSELKVTKRMTAWLSLFFALILSYLTWLVIQVSIGQQTTLGSGFVWILGTGIGVIVLFYLFALGAIRFSDKDAN